MMQILYSIGFILYILSAILSYSAKAKLALWYFPVGIVLAIIANCIWLYIAKSSNIGHETFIRGLVWGSMIVICYVAVPIMFYGVRVSGMTALGALMIVAGIFLTKIA